MSSLMNTPDISLMNQSASTAHINKATQNAKQTKDIEKIEQTAKEFEAVFLSEMLKPMFEGIKTDNEFSGGKGEEIFRGFMLQEYGKMMAESHSVGIADSVKAEMIKMQESQQ